ncbi:MAG TPA: hypothetical protein VGK91_00625 [Candidatus Udaeobacter sp.]|jgi:hypothetical protein
MADTIHDERRARVRMEILRALERVSGYSLGENILFADTNVHIEPRATLSEFRNELETLEHMALVAIVAGGPLDSSRKVRITASGRAALAEMR